MKRLKDFLEDKHQEMKNTPPAMLVMHRKSIRQFPDGTNVAMYYIDKLDKYVTVPFTNIFAAENTIDTLKTIKENTLVEFADNTEIGVTPDMAKSIIELHNKVNEENKKKIEEMLAVSTEYFNKVLEFAKKS